MYIDYDAPPVCMKTGEVDVDIGRFPGERILSPCGHEMGMTNQVAVGPGAPPGLGDINLAVWTSNALAGVFP